MHQFTGEFLRPFQSLADDLRDADEDEYSNKQTAEYDPIAGGTGSKRCDKIIFYLRTTIFTSLLGITMTLTTVWPLIISFTLSAVKAVFSVSSLERSIGS